MLVTLVQAGHFVLGLAQKALQRPVQPDRLIDLLTGTLAIGAEPDQLLHVGIGRHDLARPGDDRQKGRIG